MTDIRHVGSGLDLSPWIREPLRLAKVVAQFARKWSLILTRRGSRQPAAIEAPIPPPPAVALPPPVSEPDITGQNRTTVVADAPQAKRPRGMYARTLSELLDGIDEGFRDLTSPIDACDISRQQRSALKRLGPHVIRRRLADDITALPDNLPKDTTFSSMLFVAFPREHDQDIRHEFEYAGGMFYAFRCAKQVTFVEPARGALLYECGVAFRSRRGRVKWSQFFAAIDRETGTIKILRQLCTQWIYNERNRRLYSRREWRVPLAWGQSQWGQSEDDRLGVLRSWVIQGFGFWQQRNEMWSVSLRRDKLRATFCVPPSDTKHYFKDRGKTALSPTGRMRPIIHHVDAHDRRLYSGKIAHVREHIRGLRIFDWRAYHCAVTAPQFHRFSTQAADFGCYEEGQLAPGVQSAGTQQVAGWLARLEDDQKPPPLPRQRLPNRGAAP